MQPTQWYAVSAVAVLCKAIGIGCRVCWRRGRCCNQAQHEGSRCPGGLGPPYHVSTGLPGKSALVLMSLLSRCCVSRLASVAV